GSCLSLGIRAAPGGGSRNEVQRHFFRCLASWSARSIWIMTQALMVRRSASATFLTSSCLSGSIHIFKDFLVRNAPRSAADRIRRSMSRRMSEPVEWDYPPTKRHGRQPIDVEYRFVRQRPAVSFLSCHRSDSGDRALRLGAAVDGLGTDRHRD